MVSVPKNSPIPRLSIVVPIGRDLAAFECTLISVLENRPTGCEVLVVHDGTYDDPFELCDEVRFVMADSNGTVDLVTAAAFAARGRYVHLLSDGIRASTGWVDEALEKFEHRDAGSVAPVIRHAGTNKIISAGWCDGVDRLAKNARSLSPRVIGAHLQASFWRREIIQSLTIAFSSPQSVDLAYAYEQLIRAAGWRCVLADQCDVLCDTATLPWESTSRERGTRLRAIRNRFGRGGWPHSAAVATRAILANVLRPKYFAESIGQAAAPLAQAQLTKQFRESAIAPRQEEPDVVRMPEQVDQPTRRAA